MTPPRILILVLLALLTFVLTSMRSDSLYPSCLIVLGLVMFNWAPVSKTAAVLTRLEGLCRKESLGGARLSSVYDALSTDRRTSCVGLFSGLELSQPSIKECTECGNLTTFCLLPDILIVASVITANWGRSQTGSMFSAFIAKKLIEAFEGLAGFALLSTWSYFIAALQSLTLCTGFTISWTRLCCILWSPIPV